MLTWLWKRYRRVDRNSVLFCRVCYLPVDSRKRARQTVFSSISPYTGLRGAILKGEGLFPKQMWPPSTLINFPKRWGEICTTQDVLSTLRDWVSNVPDNCGYLIVGVSFYLNFFNRSIHICLYTQQLSWPTRSPLWISPTELSGISVSCKIYVIFFSPENCSLSFSHLDLIGKTLKDIKCAGKAYFREDLYRHFH